MMADADEDTPAPLSGNGAEADLDDETQDFRLLSLFAKSKDQSKLPRRGEKDFEPYGSATQQDALSAAREAMHGALQVGRTHQPKAHLVGHLDAKTGNVFVKNAKGQHFRVLGQGLRSGVRLLPEEALYLLERGSLDIRWVDKIDEEKYNRPSKAERLALADGGDFDGDEASDGEESDNESNDPNLPLSLQAAYALLIGKQGLTLDRYLVFAALKRSGYTLFRAPGWGGESVHERRVEKEPPPASLRAFFESLFAHLNASTDTSAHGPLVKPGLYRNYQGIYRRIALIPYYSPGRPSLTPLQAGKDSKSMDANSPSPQTHPRVLYHVHKPTPNFAKSRPGPPDFYLSIVSARDDPILTLADFDALFARTTPPMKPLHTNVNARLKMGWQSVLVAVVDSGVISFMRFAEGAFGEENLYPQFDRAGWGRGKRGGGRGGRGGGGRGRAR